MDAKSLIVFIVIAVIGLIIFANMIDYVAYYTASGQTGNVTGLGRVMLDLIVPIFILAIILWLITQVKMGKK